MSESKYSLPKTLDIVQAVDPRLGSLGDRGSQDALLGKLIIAKNKGDITDHVLAGMVAKVRNTLESGIAKYGVQSNSEAGLGLPSIVDFWKSGAKVFQEDFLEEIGYADASYKVQSEGNSGNEKEVSSEQAISVAGSASTAAKRSAENISQSPEKRQKLDVATGPVVLGVPEIATNETGHGATSEVLQEESLVSREEKPQPESTSTVQNEEELDSLEERPELDQTLIVPNQDAPAPSETRQQPEARAGIIDLTADAATAGTTARAVDASHSAKGAQPPHKDRPSDSNIQTPSGEVQGVAPAQPPTNPAAPKSKAKNPQPNLPKEDKDDDYTPSDGSEGEEYSKEAKKSKSTARNNKAQPTQKGGEAIPRQEIAAHPEVSQSQDEHLSQQQQWARDAGAQGDPVVPPTQQPANPSEMVQAADQPYVEGQLETIRSEMWSAMLAFFQENRIDSKAHSKPVMSPDPELEAVYKSIWGSNWQSSFTKLAIQKPPVILRQSYHFLGLMGTCINTLVFKTPIPWNIETELGSNWKYFEQMFKDIGHDPAYLIKVVKGKQIADPAFQENQVTTYAKKLSGLLQMSLIPHMKLMAKRGKIPKSELEDYEPWETYLEEAIRTAIILKQVLIASKLGTFKMSWPTPDKDSFMSKSHKTFPELKGTALSNANLIHAILPGIDKIKGKESEVFVRARVFAK